MAATNQLAALLDAHWPGAKEVFADIASPIRVAFLARYPMLCLSCESWCQMDHQHAVRILARALLRVIWRCWRTGTPYDCALHNGAQEHLAAAEAA